MLFQCAINDNKWYRENIIEDEDSTIDNEPYNTTNNHTSNKINNLDQSNLNNDNTDNSSYNEENSDKSFLFQKYKTNNSMIEMIVFRMFFWILAIFTFLRCILIYDICAQASQSTKSEIFYNVGYIIGSQFLLLLIFIGHITEIVISLFDAKRKTIDLLREHIFILLIIAFIIIFYIFFILTLRKNTFPNSLKNTYLFAVITMFTAISIHICSIIHNSQIDINQEQSSYQNLMYYFGIILNYQDQDESLDPSRAN